MALPPGALAVAQCAVAGALLHVVGHLGEDPREQRAIAAGLGGWAAWRWWWRSAGSRAPSRTPPCSIRRGTSRATPRPRCSSGGSPRRLPRDPPRALDGLVALPVTVALLGPGLALWRLAAVVVLVALARPGWRPGGPAAVLAAVGRTAAPFGLGLLVAAVLPALAGGLLHRASPPLVVAAVVAVSLPWRACPVGVTPVARRSWRRGRAPALRWRCSWRVRGRISASWAPCPRGGAGVAALWALAVGGAALALGLAADAARGSARAASRGGRWPRPRWIRPRRRRSWGSRHWRRPRCCGAARARCWRPSCTR
ncbi:MAG: hypothetical protein R3F59_03840 [Myxococcota bacterium]